jgi:hypothetical protein
MKSQDSSLWEPNDETKPPGRNTDIKAISVQGVGGIKICLDGKLIAHGTVRF